MICDLVEHGLDYGHTTSMINRELITDSKAEVGKSCVRKAYNRFNPEK